MCCAEIGAKNRTTKIGQNTDAGAGEVGPESAADALWCLHRLSLADHNPYTPHRAVRVHNLIQRASRETLPQDRRDLLARAAADALAAAWPDVERDTTLAQALRASADNLAAHAGAPLWHCGAHPLLFRAGLSLGQAGLVTAAVTYWRRQHTLARHHLGTDHPDTLAARHELAYWRGEAGDVAGAAAAFEQLLADRLRVLGPDHPDTLTTRHELAWCRGEAGDAAGAAAAFEQLLADRLRVLGSDHPDTLGTRHDIAHWRGEAGDAAGAAAALELVLADRLWVLGPDHPYTLTTRRELARWQGETGDAAGAAAAFEQLLADRLRVLGPDHPDTLSTSADLAYWAARC